MQTNRGITSLEILGEFLTENTFESLEAALDARNLPLVIRRGPSLEALEALVDEIRPRAGR